MGGTGDLPFSVANLPPSLSTENIRTKAGCSGALKAAVESPAATGRRAVPP